MYGLSATIEFWSKVTALGTWGLVVISLLLLVPTVVGLFLTNKAAREDLHATRDAALIAQEAAQRQIETSYRPLLIDVARHGPIYDDMDARRPEARRDGVLTPIGPPLVTLRFRDDLWQIDPRMVIVSFELPERVRIAVPLRNVGWGLAVIEPDEVGVYGEGVGPLVWCEVQRERLPPNETTRVLCECDLLSGQQPPDTFIYDLHVPYRDFAEGQHTIAVIQLQLEETTDHPEARVRSVKQRDAKAAEDLASGPGATPLGTL